MIKDTGIIPYSKYNGDNVDKYYLVFEGSLKNGSS